MSNDHDADGAAEVRALSRTIKLAGVIATGDLVVPTNPIGRTLPATYNTLPSKGVMVPPIKHSDVPAEVKQRLRRRSSASLAESMQSAGGPTAPDGDQYAAVLEERAVNPNLAAQNLYLAKQTPNDVYQRQKRASLAHVDMTIEKMLRGDA